MNFSTYRTTFSIQAFLLFLVLVTGCKKDHRTLGVEVRPVDDSIGSEFLEYPVFAYTRRYDSIASYNEREKYLGSNNDPMFGKVDVGLYLNVGMTIETFSLSFKPIPVSSEIILAVYLNQQAGDKNAALTYSIYPVQEILSTKTIYYTNNTRLHAPVAICTTSAIASANINDKPVIRIPIDTAYTNAIFRDSPFTNDVFQKKYKGFYIVASAQGNEGVIYKVDVENELSGLFLKYSNPINNDVDTFRFQFSGSNSSKFNTVKYDPSTGPASLMSQLNGDTLAGADKIYLKGMGVTRVKVHIPALMNKSDSFNIAVNRAEVIFNLADKSFNNLNSNYKVPFSLALLPIGANGRDTFALDQLNGSDNLRYDGYYDASKNQYVFNIARQVQAILKGQKANRGFHLVVADPTKLLTARRDNFIERVVLSGSGDEELRPRFRMSYIRLKKD